MNLLAGDVGGTKTSLAVISKETGPREALARRTYRSRDYDDLGTIVRTFLGEAGMPVQSACFGVGGPVVGGRAKFTNLDWVIDAEVLRSTFGWSACLLINDLKALAYGIPVLKDDDVCTLSPGEPEAGGVIAVLAPGTGLGEGYLTNDQGVYHAHASEGGHVSFGPVGELQISLLDYLNKQGYAHVSYERVCSGAVGIPNLFAYLKSTGLEEPAWLARRLAAAEDPTPVILDAARDEARPCQLAASTRDLFIAILGAEAGNLALKVLATGGVYLGGGMSPHLLPELQKPLFLEAMHDKGRFRELLTNIPAHVIVNSDAGLLGAAAFGLAM
jgi:glucokinase